MSTTISSFHTYHSGYVYMTCMYEVYTQFHVLINVPMCGLMWNIED